jgi:hypothetical protein
MATITLLAAITMLAGTPIAMAGENKQDEPKKQTACPVMGGKINKAQYVDVEDYRIYVCCPGCKAKIKADPEKYIKKMKAEGVKPEKAPKKKDAGAEGYGGHHDHSGHQHQH